MPNTSISPNMNLVVPVVSVQTGPAWASNLFTALFTTIDAHDHSSGKGVQITPAGININADLSYLALGTSYNAKDLRSTRYTQQASALALGTDVGCLYNLNGDAVWNNAAGTAIQLTKNGFVNSTALLWPLHPGTAGGTIQPTDAFLIYYADTSGGAQTFNLPQTSQLTAGRTYVFIDIKNNSQTNNITLVPNGTDKIAGVNANFVIASNGSATMVTTDAAGNWYVFQWTYQALIFPSGFSPTIGQAPTTGVTGSNLVLAPQPSTNANATPGNLQVKLGNPAGSGTQASLSIGWTNEQIALGRQSSSFCAIWLSGANQDNSAHTNANITILSDGLNTYYCAPGTNGAQYFGTTSGASQSIGMQLFSQSPSFGGGTGMLGIANRNAAPSSNPSGGGILYAEGGAAKWRGSGGAINTMAATGAGTQNTQAGVIDAQCTFVRTTTTGGTATVDTPIPTTTSVALRFVVVGRVVAGGTGTTGDTEAHTREACFKNVSGTVTQVGATTVVSNLIDTNMTGSVALSVSGTNARLTITAPAGEGATPTIDWTVLVYPVEN